ncbi:hypothetical protein J1782_24975 [Rahnella sp. BCC 1045]|uniref:hypothetical protein n=1 Tax=Rahnella sp. BCC 1045 TaxID=2816251 RepID=UPI001C2616A9|nr:hypothetical protein [Rahnella sp. BCC 1045]MBU9823148.1 hypothetical protein [Rahnella sp. BCC 1045]
MTLDQVMAASELPRMYRVIEVELDVVRNGIGSGGGVIYDIDRLEKRNIRRVRDATGWKWQLVRRDKHQEVWDYFFHQDRESLNEFNFWELR